MTTPEEFTEKAKDVIKIPNNCDGDLAALDLMYEVLTEIGYSEGVEILKKYF